MSIQTSKTRKQQKKAGAIMADQPAVEEIRFDEFELQHLRELQAASARAQHATQRHIDFLAKKYKPSPSIRWDIGNNGFVPLVPPPPPRLAQGESATAVAQNGQLAAEPTL